MPNVYLIILFIFIVSPTGKPLNTVTVCPAIGHSRYNPPILTACATIKRRTCSWASMYVNNGRVRAAELTDYGFSHFCFNHLRFCFGFVDTPENDLIGRGAKGVAARWFHSSFCGHCSLKWFCAVLLNVRFQAYGGTSGRNTRARDVTLHTGYRLYFLVLPADFQVPHAILVINFGEPSRYAC